MNLLPLIAAPPVPSVLLQAARVNGEHAGDRLARPGAWLAASVYGVAGTTPGGLPDLAESNHAGRVPTRDHDAVL